MCNRDEKILDALKKFSCPPNYSATWTQLQRETGLTTGTLTRHLQSLLKAGQIIRIGRVYSLPKYEQMLIEKLRAEEARRGAVPEEHVLNVVSGLKWFCRHETYLSGKVQPKAECGLIALQHIYTGHREIFEHFEKLLKAKDREDILKADIAQKLRIQLERAGLRLLSRTLEDMAESLLISRGDFNRYKKVEPVQEGARYKLLFKAEPHSLGEFESREKVEEFWMETFAKFVETPEFKEAIIKYENARKESTEACEILTGKTFPTSEEERVGKPCFLGMKLEQGLESLKGSCELCGGKFTNAELEKLNRILSMFSRGRVY
jgi:DNA-binding Lrp family transcriptional regulator